MASSLRGIIKLGDDNGNIRKKTDEVEKLRLQYNGCIFYHGMYERQERDPSPTITSVIGWMKYRTTKEIARLTGMNFGGIFQRSFYDHIIRNRDDYDMIVRYIHDNPMKWKYDRFNNQ